MDGSNATWYGGRPRHRSHCVRRGPSSPPLFGPCLLWPNGSPATAELLFRFLNVHLSENDSGNVDNTSVEPLRCIVVCRVDLACRLVVTGNFELIGPHGLKFTALSTSWVSLSYILL